MAYYNKVLRLLAAVLLLTSLWSLSGCATTAVDQYIHHPGSSFIDEFDPINKQMAGIYTGLEKINCITYARIIVPPNLEKCQGMPVIELLLPMEKDSDAKAILRFPESVNEKSLLKDKYSGQTVNMVFYSPSENTEKDSDKGMKLMLSNHEWNGYPSAVIIGFKNKYAAICTYRIASEDVNIVMTDFKDTGELSSRWACKNMENNVAGYMLKPFAVIYDIASVPFIFTLMLFGTLTSGLHL